MLKKSIAIFVFFSALPLLGSSDNGHRLPLVHTDEKKLPEKGINLYDLDQLQQLAEHISKRTARIESFHRPEPPFSPDHLRMEDGVGVLVEKGKLLTTARYLQGAESIKLIRRSDSKGIDLKIERVDLEKGFALLSFDPKLSPETALLEGFAPIPNPPQTEGASEVVVPTSFIGQSVSVQISAIRQDHEAIFLSGNLSNGVPAFDLRGHLVALADRPTPDRTRTVAFSAMDAKTWLEKGSSCPED